MRRVRLIFCLVTLILSLTLIHTPTYAGTQTNSRAIISPENIEHLSVVRQLGHGITYNVRWTKSGNLFVECASSGLWLYDGAHIDRPPHRLEGSTHCQRFEMNDDGTLFLWTSNDPNNSGGPNKEVAYVADTRTGKLSQFKHRFSVDGIALSDDGKYVAVYEDFNETYIYEIATGFPLLAVDYHDLEKNWVPALKDDLEAKRNDLTIELRDKSTKEVKHRIRALTTSRIEFSNDGNFYLTTRYTSEIYYTKNNNKRANLYTVNGIDSATFSPDSKTVAVGQSDGSITLLNISRLRQMATFKASDSAVISLAYRPDGKLLAAVSADLTIRFWDVDTKQIAYTQAAGTVAMGRVQLSPDGTLIAATGNRTLYMWNVDSGQLIMGERIAKPKRNDGDWVYRSVEPLYFSPYELHFNGNDQICTSDASEDVKMWNARTGESEGSKKILPGFNVYFGTDGSIFTASKQRVRRFDLSSTSTDTPIQIITPDPSLYYGSSIEGITVSMDNSSLATLIADVIEVWDLKKNSQRFKVNREHIISMALSADGSLLAVSHDNGSIEIWDTINHKLVGGLFMMDVNWADTGLDNAFKPPMSFSRDGRLFVAGSMTDGSLHFLDLKTSKEIRVISLHQDGVMDIEFSADSTRLLTAGLDGSVYLLEVTAPGETF